MHKVLRIIDKLGNAYLHFALSFFIAAGIFFFFLAFNELKNADLLVNYFRELIILSIGGGITLIPISKIDHFNPKEQKRVFISGSILLISGIVFLLSLALFSIGSINSNPFILRLGGYVFLASIFIFSFALAILFFTISLIIIRSMVDYFQDT